MRSVFFGLIVLVLISGCGSPPPEDASVVAADALENFLEPPR